MVDVTSVNSHQHRAALAHMWLDGYLTDEEDPAVIDLDKMKARAEKLAAYCVQNPKMNLMAAAENVMGK